uniref:Uncharacterized protein n=1 Tax=Panagrolaimus superbus TaxID=310955 RepID=A0A914YE33_9BILA
MSPKYFIFAFVFALYFNFGASQPAENILRIDASMMEEMAKMVLTQFSSILSPKTLAKFTAASNPSSTIISSTSAPSVIGKIRQCTCSETDECISEAYRSNSFCQNSCKSHLEYYSSHSEEFLACFPKNPSGHFMISKCLKENIPQFCAADGSRFTFIPKPSYNQSSTFEFNFDLGKNVIDMLA